MGREKSKRYGKKARWEREPDCAFREKKSKPNTGVKKLAKEKYLTVTPLKERPQRQKPNKNKWGLTEKLNIKLPP